MTMSGNTGFGGLFLVASACGTGRMGDSGDFAGDSWPCVCEEDCDDVLAMRVELYVFVWFE
jgi:hypothetical protein